MYQLDSLVTMVTPALVRAETFPAVAMRVRAETGTDLLSFRPSRWQFSSKVPNELM